MEEIEIQVPQNDIKVSDFLQTTDYGLQDTIDIKDGFSITYDGSPIRRDVSNVDMVVQFSLNFNIDMVDVVAQYIAYRCSNSTISVDGDEVEATKEKIDEAFRDAIEEED